MSTAIIDSTIQSNLDAHHAARQQFEAEHDAYCKLRDQQNTHQQSAEAAEASALSLKEQARQLLRKLMGKPNKQLHDLRADERAAYSLAEDYRSFTDEMALHVEEGELAAAAAKLDYHESYRGLISAYAAVQKREAIAALEPLLKAIWLYERELMGEGRFASWVERGYDTALDCALADFSKLISQQAAGYKLDIATDPVLSQAKRPEGLSDVPDYSPLQLKMRREELIKCWEELA